MYTELQTQSFKYRFSDNYYSISIEIEDGAANHNHFFPTILVIWLDGQT